MAPLPSRTDYLRGLVAGWNGASLWFLAIIGGAYLIEGVLPWRSEAHFYATVRTVMAAESGGLGVTLMGGAAYLGFVLLLVGPFWFWVGKPILAAVRVDESAQTGYTSPTPHPARAPANQRRTRLQAVWPSLERLPAIRETGTDFYGQRRAPTSAHVFEAIAMVVVFSYTVVLLGLAGAAVGGLGPLAAYAGFAVLSGFIAVVLMGLCHQFLAADHPWVAARSWEIVSGFDARESVQQGTLLHVSYGLTWALVYGTVFASVVVPYFGPTLPFGLIGGGIAGILYAHGLYLVASRFWTRTVNRGSFSLKRKLLYIGLHAVYGIVLGVGTELGMSVLVT